MVACPDHRAVYTWPEGAHPRERLARYGAETLSTAELLAIIARPRTAHHEAIAPMQHLLGEYGGIAGLAEASITELAALPGVSEAKAAQIKAALELGRRLLVTEATCVQIRSPRDAAAMLQPEMGLLPQEVLRTVLLTTKNRVIAAPVIYQGSVHTAVLRVGEVFRAAVKRNCASIIVAHNHPSGDPTPSPDDVAATREIVAAGKLLDIDVLDHLIIARHSYVSLKERGLGFDGPARPT